MSSSAERRELSFHSLDEAVAEAEQLAQGTVRTTGNHSFGQILEHLARTHDMCTGKMIAPTPPFYMRVMIALLKPIILNGKPLKPGAKLPKNAEDVFWPDREFDVQEALQHFCDSVKTYNDEGPLEVHPVFGKISREKNLDLNCRHCALHLGFVHPA